MTSYRLLPHEYVDHVRADAAVIRAAAVQAPDAPVPDLDGWTSITVLEHVGDVYQHKVETLRNGAPPDPWPPPGPDPEPFAWFDSAIAGLLDELSSRSPDEPAWTWVPSDQTVGFWQRRMAHESAVHRQDSEGAVGIRTPIDDRLAVDGIDEILGFFLDLPRAETDVAAATGVVELAAGDGRWRIDVTRRQVSVSPGVTDPAAAATVTGTPDAVLRWLWRGDASAITSAGDPDLVAAVRSHILAVAG